MGPRLDRRGNLRSAVTLWGRARLLQWGHAWTGVGMIIKYDGKEGRFKLQWGHAWTGVGISTSRARTRPTSGFNGATPGQAWESPFRRSRTAGGPQLQWGHAWTGVGMVVTTTPRPLPVLASMGPRLDRRGNLEKVVTCSGAFAGFNGATPGQAWESPPTSPSRRPWTCFNGATPGQAWEFGAPPERAIEAIRFNGATPGQAWEYVVPPSAGPPGSGFNGATPGQAWEWGVSSQLQWATPDRRYIVTRFNDYVYGATPGQAW